MELSNLSNVATNVATTYNTKASSKTGSEKSSSKADSEKSSSFSEEAVVYEKSEKNNTGIYSKNSTDRSALIEMMKADQEKLKNNLFDIVKQSIAGQGNAFALASENDYWRILASGNFTASAEQIAQAKKDIADDGYWGVDQTSSRIVDFAIALSGNDTSKADTLLEAFKKGFDQATSAWGKTLPDISQRTYAAVEEKFEAWKNGTYESEA